MTDQLTGKQLDDINFLKEMIPVLIRTSTELENSNKLLQAKVADLEKELKRKNRLAVIGEMAACVAHEIRNPLATIELYSSRLQRELAASPDMQNTANKISSAIQDLNMTVEDILSFAGEIIPSVQQCELVSIVNGALALADKQIINKNAVVEKKFCADRIDVQADPSMLQRVFLNLIINAVQAVATHGTITVSVSVISGRAAVSIADNGCGIPQDALEKLFTPFFTNKSKGTGLGLATAHRIIEAHKGTIEGRNNTCKGATFTVLLPLLNP